jgi:hypothetical protein
LSSLSLAAAGRPNGQGRRRGWALHCATHFQRRSAFVIPHLFTKESPPLWDRNRDVWWIWFGTGGDSVETHALADGETTPGPTHVIMGRGLSSPPDSASDAACSPCRLIKDGIVWAWVRIGDPSLTPYPEPHLFLPDTVGYTLRTLQRGPAPPPALRATDKWASLDIASKRGFGARFSIVPLSIARSVRDRTRWIMFARTYNVALVADSVYEICGVPCSAPDTVRLIPGARVTKRF